MIERIQDHQKKAILVNSQEFPFKNFPFLEVLDTQR